MAMDGDDAARRVPVNDLTDRMTPAERRGAPDCLVELALAWLQRPLGGLSLQERAHAMDGLALLIAQMRHVPAALQESERRRWIDRAVLRLCQQVREAQGHEQAVREELERRVTVALLQFHDWREHVAPPFRERTAAGPSDGGEVTI